MDNLGIKYKIIEIAKENEDFIILKTALLGILRKRKILHNGEDFNKIISEMIREELISDRHFKIRITKKGADLESNDLQRYCKKLIKKFSFVKNRLKEREKWEENKKERNLHQHIQ